MLRPETPVASARGRTTQNLVSAAVKLRASWSSWTVAMTRERSSASLRLFTVPISTSLYLSRVLPASMPSAVRNEMVIVGPRSTSIRTTRVMPTSAATIGISQISDGSQRRRFTTDRFHLPWLALSHATLH